MDKHQDSLKQFKVTRNLPWVASPKSSESNAINNTELACLFLIPLPLQKEELHHSYVGIRDWVEKKWIPFLAAGFLFYIGDNETLFP